MKRFLIILIIALPILSFTDSKSYVWVNPQPAPDLAKYESAVYKSDMDKYRYMDQRNTLHFDIGMDLILLSGNELSAMGITYNKDHVRTSVPEFDTHSIFKLSDDGILLE